MSRSPGRSSRTPGSILRLHVSWRCPGDVPEEVLVELSSHHGPLEPAVAVVNTTRSSHPPVEPVLRYSHSPMWPRTAPQPSPQSPCEPQLPVDHVAASSTSSPPRPADAASRRPLSQSAALRSRNRSFAGVGVGGVDRLRFGRSPAWRELARISTVSVADCPATTCQRTRTSSGCSSNVDWVRRTVPGRSRSGEPRPNEICSRPILTPFGVVGAHPGSSSARRSHSKHEHRAHDDRQSVVPHEPAHEPVGSPGDGAREHELHPFRSSTLAHARDHVVVLLVSYNKG